MDSSFLKDQDRICSPGETSVKKKSMEQPPPPKDERNVSANPSADATILGPSRDIREQPQFSDGSGGVSILPAANVYPSHGQTAPYGGYVDFSGTWDGYPQYLNAAEGLHISPVVLGENQSLIFHSGYCFNPEMAYGQYSPVATPLPSVLVDGQLYSSQQIPFSPSFYPQSTPPNVPSPVPSELMTSETDNENLIYGPGSGYLVQFGSFGGLNMSGTPGANPITSPAAYPPAMGILGPYEHHAGQMSEKRPYHGYGTSSASSAGNYQSSLSYQNTNFGSGSVSHLGSHERARFTLDKGRRRERDQDSICTSNDSLGFDRNRGPRASKFKGKSANKRTFANAKDDSCSFDTQSNSYNRPDFVADYENAKFFVIKSFSEDNVHKSIKYNVWASTPHGNRKLDAAYHEAQTMGKSCPIFLLFSVNASGQFCGVAEMVGPVDFEKDADYWQQDRWSGRFPVKWHIIKDVPNSRFRHILLENNENKPVTHSRDSQEVKQEHGIEMLKIFKDHEAITSILDDFDFYDQREMTLKEQKAKHQAIPMADMDQMAGHFERTLQFDSHSKETSASERSSISRNENIVSHADDSNATSVNLVNDSSGTVLHSQGSVNCSLSQSLNSGEKSNNTQSAELNGEHQD